MGSLQRLQIHGERHTGGWCIIPRLDEQIPQGFGSSPGNGNRSRRTGVADDDDGLQRPELRSRLRAAIGIHKAYIKKLIWSDIYNQWCDAIRHQTFTLLSR
eukprot:jgi/Psemu1/303352/fgenesh1_kg.101_\